MKEFDDLLSGVYSATTTEVRVLVRELSVRIGILARPVSILIWYDGRSAEPYEFENSATMRTPLHESIRSSGLAASEGDAIRDAVRLLTQDYEDAVRNGHMPDDDWLVRVAR